MGKGHLLFFYSRLGYLAKRHAELIREMKRRGYKPSFTGIDRSQFPGIPDSCWNDWPPHRGSLAAQPAAHPGKNRKARPRLIKGSSPGRRQAATAGPQPQAPANRSRPGPQRP